MAENEALKTARERLGYTQARMADEARMCLSAYKRCEKLGKDIEIDAAIRIANVLGIIDLREIFDAESRNE